MSAPEVHLTIDGRPVTVPPGTLLVDAAKTVGIDIPVFCYHPKLEPVGMCRMCLVEVGRPVIDRATGQVRTDERDMPVLQYGVKLETACTTPVGEGWDVRVMSEKAVQGRNEIVEYLLTSHPLDCPICDKGGECPLQNLTMGHGPGTSRFVFSDKAHLDKRVPLGDLIVLDRERCIQCARCIRFQEEIVDDPVIGFYERGRKLEIVTFSDPGFDSYFSGNTTDICPVGALTTTDFRFGARPWELNNSASICPHCPVGCNLTMNTRREAASGGRSVIKRVMPRQNEAVNEIWICDKGRFAHHYASNPARLQRPLVRRDGELQEAGWDEALEAAARGLRQAGSQVVGLAGGRLSNEDLFCLRRAIEAVGGQTVLDGEMGGGDLTRRFGMGRQADLGRLGQGDAILVVAADLHEQAPVWWLRVKQAAERGATLIAAGPRPTRLEAHASHVLRYGYGEEVQVVRDLARADGASAAAGDDLARAASVVVFFGSEGLDLGASQALGQACSALLRQTGHAGKPTSGLIGVWASANSQGAWDLGWRPSFRGVASELASAKAAYIAGADPLGDDPATARAFDGLGFLVVQELYLTATAARADVVLPAQSFIEREGSFTSGEGRVQRFYPAVPPQGDVRPDWWIAANLGAILGGPAAPASASVCFEELAGSVAALKGLRYQDLAKVDPQWPLVGGDDLYFGGTAYANLQGLGVKLANGVELGESPEAAWPEPTPRPAGEGLLLVPVHRLYDRGTTLLPTTMLEAHRAPQAVLLNPEDARGLGWTSGASLRLEWDGTSQVTGVLVSEGVPPGVGLVPRSSGLPVLRPVRARLQLEARA